MSDKACNFLGAVNSFVYSLSTGISVRESIFDFSFSLFTLKIDFKYRLLILRLTFGGLRRPLGSLSNDDADGNKNGKKAIGLISKTTTLHVQNAFFVHFFAVVARL